MIDVPEDAPPVGEEVHIPGPSILPFVTAIAITLMVIGTTISWILSGIGLAIFLLVVGMWIRDTRRDMAALPEDHHH
jgi:hypothetical protein